MNDKHQHALLELLVEQMYLTVPISLGVSLLVAIVVAPEFGTALTSIWFIYGLLVGVGRYIYFKKVMPKKMADSQYQTITRFIAFALFLAGLQWGFAGYFFVDPQHPNIYLFVAIAILGMVSASLSNLSVMPNLWLLFATTVFTFIIARMISLGNWSTVLMSIFFVLGLWALSRKLGQQISQSITMDFQNAELLAQVNKAKEVAEKNSLEKSRFLAATSHDLRQPLHAQGLYLAALKEQLNTQEQTSLLNKVNLSNQALNTLFESLLEISQLDANSVDVNCSHLPLIGLCQDIVTEFEPLADDKGLRIDLFKNDCTVFTDPVLFKRIIRNLLSNALKYTNEGGVTLEVEQANDVVILSIIDTGIGIPASEQETIFEEYVQLDNKKRDRLKGVGLGLALVQRMCKLLDHKINVVSEPGKGSCFSLTLPLGDPNKQIQAEHKTQTSSVQGLNIFVIDNDQSILDSMNTLQSDWQCNFELFSDVEQIEAFISNNDEIPDAIVSDYRLADDIDGIELITKIRNFYQKHIPALLISGDTDKDLFDQTQNSDLYLLHKPINAEKLKLAIAILAR